MSQIFLAGASRGVGREIAKQLVARGHQVIALLRSDQAKAELTAMGLTVVKGDALEAAAMIEAIAAHPPDAVISTIGGLPEDGSTRADFLGNKHLIDGAVAAQVKRFILISSIGSGDSAQALPPNVLEVLGAVLEEKAQAEDYLRESGLAYTVIRPGGLLSGSATGEEVLTEDVTVAGSIPRAAVARLAVRCLESDRAVNKTFSAIDLSMQRSKTDFEQAEL
ncbi:SDR family oxidoreductase [Leptolyngbya sp. BC1307]|uniref:SDR family oxidoreductase n=1 Tax=Leptolyngbya sp. BC1307 TaxID=2029589 RepID=UPI000EFAE8F0|nr:SDR family oxidoreductase [Leptolyngbya sp. BC1307]